MRISIRLQFESEMDLGRQLDSFFSMLLITIGRCIIVIIYTICKKDRQRQEFLALDMNLVRDQIYHIINRSRNRLFWDVIALALA